MLQGSAGGSDWSTGLLFSCPEINGVGACGLRCKALCCSCIVYAEIAAFQGANEGILGSSVNGDGNYWPACCLGCSADFIPAVIGAPGLSCFLYAVQRSAVRGVMACQMTFAWIVAAIVAATALPCPRRAGSWLLGVLNVCQWALLCLHSRHSSCTTSSARGVQS